MMNAKLRSTLPICVLAVALCTAPPTLAQDERPASPPGKAATQIGDAWIEVTYSRPILRGRDGIFGEGDSYGAKVKAGAPVWRAGANATTRISTDVPLKVGDTVLPAGEYSFFVDLAEDGWTAIFSNQEFMETPDRAKIDEGITWGSYGYDPEQDAARAQMEVERVEDSVDQLTYLFTDVSDEGGKLVLVWDDHAAALPFSVAE